MTLVHLRPYLCSGVPTDLRFLILMIILVPFHLKNEAQNEDKIKPDRPSLFPVVIPERNIFFIFF